MTRFELGIWIVAVASVVLVLVNTLHTIFPQALEHCGKIRFRVGRELRGALEDPRML